MNTKTRLRVSLNGREKEYSIAWHDEGKTEDIEATIKKVYNTLILALWSFCYM